MRHEAIHDMKIRTCPATAINNEIMTFRVTLPTSAPKTKISTVILLPSCLQHSRSSVLPKRCCVLFFQNAVLFFQNAVVFFQNAAAFFQHAGLFFQNVSASCECLPRKCHTQNPAVCAVSLVFHAPWLQSHTRKSLEDKTGSSNFRKAHQS